MAAKKSALPQVPERLLARLWRERAARAGPLAAQDGRRLRVRYPGRLSSAAVPDFFDAVLEDEAGRVVRGDVEVHRHEADWLAHGHSRDARYDNVVLHVVLQPAAHPLAGNPPPALALGPLAFRAPPAAESPPHWDMLARHGYRQPGRQEELGALLDRAGRQRFLLKAASFAVSVERVGAPQALYEGLMEALGYSHNRAPFAALSRLAPYEEVREAALRAAPPARQAVALALLRARSAGLAWHTFRVRPGNHPGRRMAGAAALVARYAEAGLVGGLERLALAGDHRTLEAGLTVCQEGATLVGRGRAADMAVNVALPFFHALAGRTGGSTMAEQTLRLYERWPLLQENELTREMSSLLGLQGLDGARDGARRQQGLIHLYRLLTGTGSTEHAAGEHAP